jgi:hypothetical protein
MAARAKVIPITDITDNAKGRLWGEGCRGGPESPREPGRNRGLPMIAEATWESNQRYLGSMIRIALKRYRRILRNHAGAGPDFETLV